MLTRRTLLVAATAAPGRRLAGAPAPAPARIVVAGGRLRFGDFSVRCAVGRTGVRADKREGDGATPTGRFPLREVLFRPDRGKAPPTGLPISAIGPDDAWSDDPADPRYNQRVTEPSRFHAEPLWRRDGLYDVLAVIGTNDHPVVPGRGSAIFLHIARPNYGGTDGCVAIARPDLLRLLALCAAATEIEIG
jgi:L,D-peptidoglycan transpeptidase YkuD (ErfK/YbiS/YcfS/YnhG family)